ncbi:gliding motility-associated ABC transporter ATP-binding subunit GldA [Wenyingzhuangia fucanilytica]|uniref:Gliding motility-associated ABC transporter ATP-binding subunit GldA n=1 Tax=Wenyingzhuangia fucanilytica TaxID=1790137 RepID=A0A1B1Y2J7_9FLAO|nr:gliding motility-associated ABC transporter ATP-binding subunit GldA [Wenyingzhuangia fucanilytica]ANW94991.1 gliding motility-associated ABC transporter ATP-binding subunit GldA [Wenyingzhuangia fucanilytica]
MSIKVVDVSKQYGEQIAVNGLDFEINKGEIVGFLGPNGAGKSTLMKMLTGYIKPTKGALFINDIPVIYNQKKTNKHIGYLPEHNPLYKDMFVKEYLRFVAQIHEVDKNEIDKVISRTGLTAEASKKIHQLSKGYQQRVGLAAALIHNPDVLILDEPTTGLDPNQILEIRALIKEIGKEKTVLFSTHIMQEVEAVCDRVIIINKGNLRVDEKLSTLKAGQQQIIQVTFDFKIEEQFVKQISNLVSWVNYHDNEWELTFDTQKDQRAAIFDFAQTQGLKILQMNTKNKTLETLFKEVTA